MSDLFGVNEETFLRCTKTALEAIVDRISHLIYWPKKTQYLEISNKFNRIGKYVQIYFFENRL